MMRTLALSTVTAMGLLLLPAQTESLSAAPTLAAKIATPDSTVEQVRRGGRGGGRSFGGRSHGGRSFGRSFSGGRHFRGGRHYGRHYGHHRHGRHHRRGYIYGAGIPFFYGGYGYYGGGCGYYYRKWQRTGSRYWRNRYYACAW